METVNVGGHPPGIRGLDSKLNRSSHIPVLVRIVSATDNVTELLQAMAIARRASSYKITHMSKDSCCSSWNLRPYPSCQFIPPLALIRDFKLVGCPRRRTWVTVSDYEAKILHVKDVVSACAGLVTFSQAPKHKHYQPSSLPATLPNHLLF